MRKNTSMALRGRMGISDLKQYLTKIAFLHHPSPQTHHPPKTTDSQCIRLVEPMKPDCVSALQRKRLESWPEELRARLSPARFESKNCGICGHFPQIPEQSRRVSLHFRLYGGEGDIRTLGTGLNRARARTSVTYRESTTSEFSPRLLALPVSPLRTTRT